MSEIIHTVEKTKDNVLAELNSIVAANTLQKVMIKTKDTWIALFPPMANIRVAESFYDIVIDNAQLDFYILTKWENIEVIEYDKGNEKYIVKFIGISA